MCLFKTLFITATLLMPTLVSSADKVHRIEHKDGSVEFTNVKGSSGKLFTNSKKTSQTAIYKSTTNDITRFSDQKPEDIAYEVLRFDCYACNPTSKVDWHSVALNTNDYVQLVKQAANKNKLDPALLRALIHAESAFRPKALSRQGAQGLTQLMPTTAKDMGVKNAFDPKQNINGGAKYLAMMLKKFNGNTRLATAAYNAGPNAVQKYNGIPPYQETQVYVDRVQILFNRYQQLS
jgi:soluble lytic murein transglycosylase-like protein